MVLAHRCAKMDSISRGNECNPATISYTPYNLFSAETDVLAECTTSNENHAENPECAIDACVIEGSFTLKYLHEFISGIQFNSTFQHTGNFDADQTCGGGAGKQGKGGISVGGLGPRECCGDQPDRFPYGTMDGLKQCCAGAVFSVVDHECCEDGVLANPGDC